MDIKNNNEVNYDNNYDTLKNIKENSSIPDFNEDPIEALTKISDEALKNDSNYLKSDVDTNSNLKVTQSSNVSIKKTQNNLNQISFNDNTQDVQPKHIEINLQEKIPTNDTLGLGIKDSKDESCSSSSKSTSKYKESPTFSLQETLIMILLTGIICTIASGTVVNHKYSTKNGTSYNTLLKDENIQEFLDVYATLNENYYQNVDKKAAIDGAISGLMSAAGDNYTSYLDKDDADILNNSLNGKYDGIGIAISTKETGLIEKVYPNTPAKASGIQIGDKITSINGNSISEMSSSDIAKLIKESTDGKVKLTILRGEETLEMEVEIKSLATPVVDYKILEGNNKKVGYLAISSFSDTLVTQVESALNELEMNGIESLIIDLRNNGGGLLTAAKDTASLFLEKGKTIYGLEGNENNGKTKFYYDETETSRNYPIVVLVNGATASASEILTSALKDSYGATTVGTTTYGKGKVQQTKKLSDGSLVKYTTSRWLTPNNECIDEYGISPEYGVEIEYQYDDAENIIGYTDTQLAKARSILGLPEYDEN